MNLGELFLSALMGKVTDRMGNLEALRNKVFLQRVFLALDGKSEAFDGESFSVRVQGYPRE